jgi:hypothetical protein
MFPDSANICIKRLAVSDWWWSMYHLLLFGGLSVLKVELVQEFRNRNPFLFTGHDTLNSFFKTLRAHEVFSFRFRQQNAQSKLSLGRIHLEQCKIPIVGFASGTLLEHAETGEERFTVSWDRSDNSVWYEIVAFSKPRAVLAKLGYPFSQKMQRKFGRASLGAMMKAVRTVTS